MGDISTGSDRPASESVGADVKRPQAAGDASARLVAERRFADRRLAELAQAVREHEGEIRGPIQRSRPHDRRLYKRLRDICAERIGQ
jgi:hypothetical protein